MFITGITHRARSCTSAQRQYCTLTLPLLTPITPPPQITNMAHSLVWNTDFIARVNTQSKYFDDFREKEAAKPLRDTRAVRLRNQRAKQMAGRFRLANNKAQKEKDAGGHGPPMSARSDRSDAGSNKQVPTSCYTVAP